LGYDKKILFFSAAPLILGSLLEPLAGIVDTAFVGHLGVESLGALSIGVSIFNSFFWVFNFLIHIPMESVSRGKATDRETLLIQAKVGLISSILVGVFSFLVLYLFSKEILLFAGADSTTFSKANNYFLIRLCGQPFVLVYFCLLSILRGVGKSKESLIPVALSVLINILVTYLLIYHVNLGIKGAAFGTLVSYVIGLILVGVLLKREFGREIFRLKNLPPKESFFQFSKKSFFLFVRSFCLTAIFFMSTKVAAKLGVYNLSAYQIVLQFWLFSSFFLDGVAMVGNIETAKLSVKKDKQSFNELAISVFNLSFWLGAFFLIFYFLLENPLVSLFTNDEHVLRTLKVVWPVVLVGQIINALAFSIDGIYFGMGQHSRLAKMMLFNIVVVFAPFALGAVYFGSLQLLVTGLLFTSVFRWFFLKKYMMKDFLVKC